MVPLHILIKLRQSLERLNDAETDLFYNAMVGRFGRDLLRSAIFVRFSAHSDNASTNDGQTVEGLAELVNGIITQRDLSVISEAPCEEATEQYESAQQKEVISILSLSDVLIGKIGSYLRQNEHIVFGRCCRAMYIGVNDPNSLQELSLFHLPSNETRSFFNLQKYCQIHTLRLHGDDDSLDFLAFTDQINFSRLTRLEICNNYTSDHIELENFLNQPGIPCANVTDLTLSEFNVEMSDFIRIISKFPRIETLYLISCSIEALDDSTVPGLLTHLLKLKAFVVDGEKGMPEAIGEIISMLSSQLKALSLRSAAVSIPNGTRFKSLEEFELTGPSYISRSILPRVRRSATRVKRMHLEWIKSESQQLVNLLSESHHLEQLIVSGDLVGDLAKICAAIDRGLFNTRRMNRSKLHIELWMDVADQQIGISEIIFTILKVMNALYAARIKNFFFQLRLKNRERHWIAARMAPNEWKMIMEDFVTDNDSRFDISWMISDLMVSNKGCKIREHMINDWMIEWTAKYL